MTSNTEVAKLQDGQLVYGTYEEVEAYAEAENTCVDKYFDHVAPFVVSKNFKYIGNSMSDIYTVSTPWDYINKKPDVTDKW